MTIQDFKTQAISKLSSSPLSSASPSLDVQVFLEYKLKLSKTQLLLQNQKEIDKIDLNWLNNAIEQRTKGLPVAYITNQKEFYGFNFYVTPDVLIPKPDTEILVERALEIITEKIKARKNSIISVLDMCTGSGCIAISIMKTLIESYKIPISDLPKFTLVDISNKALAIAHKNSTELIISAAKTEEEKNILLSKIKFIQSNLFEQVPYHFDVILSNPPYIPHKMVYELLKDGRNEPILALDGDIDLNGNRAISFDGTEENDGLSIIKNLILQSTNNICPLGSMLIETGEYNAEKTADFAKKTGYKAKILKDLENQLRVVEISNHR